MSPRSGRSHMPPSINVTTVTMGSLPVRLVPSTVMDGTSAPLVSHVMSHHRPSHPPLRTTPNPEIHDTCKLRPLPHTNTAFTSHMVMGQAYRILTQFPYLTSYKSPTLYNFYKIESY